MQAVASRRMRSEFGYRSFLQKVATTVIALTDWIPNVDGTVVADCRKGPRIFGNVHRLDGRLDQASTRVSFARLHLM